MGQVETAQAINEAVTLDDLYKYANTFLYYVDRIGYPGYVALILCVAGVVGLCVWRKKQV